MSKSAYPTYSDISTYFSNAGVNVPASGFVVDVIDGVIAEWNDHVGYTFFSDSASGSSTYLYPHDGVLFLDQYYSSITSVSVSGTVLSTDQYTVVSGREIHLGYSPRGLVTVTGLVGYTSIPVNVWMKIQDLVAYRVINLNPSRQFEKVKQMDMELTLGKMRDVPYELQRLAMRYKF